MEMETLSATVMLRALHLVCMVLEGALSMCLVAAKQPSNTVTDPREESLAVDA